MFPVVTSAWTFWLVTACILLVAWVLCGYCLPRTLRWQSTRYTLTSQRIVAKYGMLRRREWQVSLAAIRQVWVVQSVLQRILRSGNISLDTGHHDPAVLADVPEAGKFRDFVLEAIDELPPASVLLEEDSRGDGLEDVDRYWEGRSQQRPRRPREGGRDERWQ
ncbi:PH domain-containing protein [Arthrobacter sp. R1-13]